MSRELTGQANHVFSEDEITSIKVYVIEPEDERMEPFVSVANESGEGVIIHSLEQWEQLNALVRRAFDGLSE